MNPGLRCAKNLAGGNAAGTGNAETRAEWNGIRSGLEIGGVPEEIPAMLGFAGQAEIVGGVGDVTGVGALDAHDGVDLPAFQELAKALPAGKSITSCESEAVPHVEVAAAITCPRIPAVLRERSETILGTVVQAMTVGVTGGEIQPVSNALGQGGLQAIVGGVAVVRRLVDKA